MDKVFQKKDFGAAQMAEMKPGEQVTVICKNFAEVLSLRSSAVQFVKTKQPDGIARFSAASNTQEDGSCIVSFEAIEK